jgi:conjugative relaxase-like TrwC/TraI family protein
VLTIAKLGVGQQNYYLSKVASGIEDYYSGRGEAPGRWMGRSAARLGLEGNVRSGQLGRLMGGVDPVTGVRLAGREGAARVPGWDLTFSAPKSVSVLYGLSEPHTAREVAAAHDAAVAAGLAYLERYAACSRRRVDGDIAIIRAEGLSVAAFRHRTSRAGDPQLHTHALAVNVVEFIDGGWGAIHSPVIYRHARTAGFVYQAVLRGELTERLGVTWGNIRNGYAEIEGIDQRLLDLFSKRRTEILTTMAARGEHSARAAQVAAYVTRDAKTYNVDPDRLRQRWASEAQTTGIDPASLREALGHSPPQMSAEILQQAIVHMISPEGLTQHDASFDHRDVMRAWCQALPPGTKLRLADLEALRDDLLSQPDVVPINDGLGRLAGHEILYTAHGTPTTASHTEPRWSTAGMLAVERDLLETADSASTSGAGRVPPTIVVRHLGNHRDLSDEQVAMVRHITTSDAGVEVVIGRAGTGKTYALAAAGEIWKAAGFRVIGLGLAARAAKQLHISARIPSTTVARFLLDVERAPPGLIGDRHVIVVDEASMVDTRRLARIVSLGRRTGAKVVLVGDHQQLPAVEAGGAFAALAERLGAVELVENRRQVERWERDLLDRLRSGADGRDGITTILATYDQHGRLHIGYTPALVQDAMVQDWYTAHTDGARAGMIALRRRDVADLNARARALLVADGTVAPTGIQLSATTFAAGDRVVCTRGNRDLGVHNALFATITHTDPDRGTVLIQPDNQTHPLALPHWYLARGHLRHAYATTIHKAQGATYDHTLVFGDERLYRQASYTGLSRGRARNDIYLVDTDTRIYESDIEQHGEPPFDQDSFDRIVRAIGRDGAKTLATHERDKTEYWGHNQPLRDLWDERDQLVERHAADTQDTPEPVTSRDPGTESHLARLAELNDMIRYRTQLAGHAAEADRPQHIIALLGDSPVDTESRQRWRQAAAAIESYRARWASDLAEPVTSPSRSAAQRAHLAHVIDTIGTASAAPEPTTADVELGSACVDLA